MWIHSECPPFRIAGTMSSNKLHACRYSNNAVKRRDSAHQQSSLRFGLFCPNPSSLNRLHPPHSQARSDFAAVRLIPNAFAVRERLGDPRATTRILSHSIKRKSETNSKVLFSCKSSSSLLAM